MRGQAQWRCDKPPRLLCWLTVSFNSDCAPIEGRTTIVKTNICNPNELWNYCFALCSFLTNSCCQLWVYFAWFKCCHWNHGLHSTEQWMEHPGKAPTYEDSPNQCLPCTSERLSHHALVQPFQDLNLWHKRTQTKHLCQHDYAYLYYASDSSSLESLCRQGNRTDPLIKRFLKQFLNMIPRQHCSRIASNTCSNCHTWCDSMNGILVLSRNIFRKHVWRTLRNKIITYATRTLQAFADLAIDHEWYCIYW